MIFKNLSTQFYCIYLFLDGKIVVWPFERHEKRTKENYKLDVEASHEINNNLFQKSHGIKGECVLNQLRFYHPIISTNIDYMHSVLEGVVKRFFFIWFEDVDNPGSLKEYQNMINKRLFDIKPPSFIPSKPRSTKLWRLWHAHEFLFFLLYYSLPVFFKLMPHVFFLNLMKLVLCMQHLLRKNIVREDLDTIQSILNDFVAESESIYGKSVLLSGMHELLHLVECTKSFGPLNCVNLFQFEEINRKILRFVKGRDLISEEFLKTFSIYQALEHFRSNCVKNKKVADFLDEHCQFKNNIINYSKISRMNKKKKYTLIDSDDD